MQIPGPIDQGIWRQEIKFVSSPLNLPLIKNWIANSEALFEPTYPARQINNIYFDTIDLLAFDENLSGASSRTKVRLRWYGEDLSPINPVLEIKQRKNDLGFKTLISLERPIELETKTWDEILTEIRSQLTRAEQFWINEFSYPALINRYRRTYYESADRVLRLTVDTGQVVYDQTRHVTPNLKNKANQLETVVVEMKFSPCSRPLASRIVRDIPLRRSRNSKYTIGINSTYYQY